MGRANRGRGRPVRCRTIPEGVRGKARSPTGLHGGGPGALGDLPALPASRQSHLGWQPSRFLADRAEAEHALALAQQLGSVNAAAAELGTTWPSLRKAFARHGLGMPALHPEAVRQRAIDAARQRSRQQATPTLDPVFVALNLGASRPGTVTGRAVPVGPPRGAVRDAERGRGGRAVQRKSRPPANHPRLGDHPTSRPQLPAGRPTR
jgi:hypothetical protein